MLFYARRVGVRVTLTQEYEELVKCLNSAVDRLKTENEAYRYVFDTLMRYQSSLFWMKYYLLDIFLSSLSLSLLGFDLSVDLSFSLTLSAQLMEAGITPVESAEESRPRGSCQRERDFH